MTVSVSWRSLRPGWLRPSALAALVAVHGAIFYTAGTPPTPSSPLEAVAIPVIALGDDAQEQTAQEAIAEPRPPAAQAVPQPESRPSAAATCSRRGPAVAGRAAETAQRADEAPTRRPQAAAPCPAQGARADGFALPRKRARLCIKE